MSLHPRARNHNKSLAKGFKIDPNSKCAYNIRKRMDAAGLPEAALKWDQNEPNSIKNHPKRFPNALRKGHPQKNGSRGDIGAAWDMIFGAFWHTLGAFGRLVDPSWTQKASPNRNFGHHIKQNATIMMSRTRSRKN